MIKIALAQTAPITGDINSNIKDHKRWIDLAVNDKCDLIVFPELSLTGYEPTMAKKLALSITDPRLDDFKKLGNQYKISIAVGAPIQTQDGICIGLILYQSNENVRVYSKKYLHPDEMPFFIPGENLNKIKVNQVSIAFAICYEINIQEHVEEQIKTRPSIYIASVAKFKNGMDQATKRLGEIAKDNKLPVGVCNSVGAADQGICAGGSAFWDQEGNILEQLDNTQPEMLIINTSSKTTKKINKP